MLTCSFSLNLSSDIKLWKEKEKMSFSLQHLIDFTEKVLCSSFCYCYNDHNNKEFKMAWLNLNQQGKLPVLPHRELVLG